MIKNSNKRETNPQFARSKLLSRKFRFFLILRNARGSATLEFVALAIPLLVPLLLFSAQLSLTTSKGVLLHNALRESSHLFISSRNDFLARRNVDLFLSKEFPSAVITITCNATPCLTHNSLVYFKISVDGISQQYTFSVGSWQ